MGRFSTDSQVSFNSHRALSTILRTTLIVTAIALPFTLRSTARYRSTSRLLLETGVSAMPTLANGSVILEQDFSSHTIPTQIQVLKAPKLLSDAYRDADVPQGAVTVTPHQIDNTDVVEIVVEGYQQSYVERMAKTLPNSYLNYVTGHRKMELTNAFQFSTNLLAEYRNKLSDLKLKREQLTRSGAGSAELTEVDDDISIKHSSVLKLAQNVEELRLWSKLVHDPVTVIAPAEQAEQISRPRARFFILSVMFGMVIGIAAAAFQKLTSSKTRQ